ncbi:mechanosensitive ion channel [Subsaximicrobium wynnwilliamsii]|uniref:Mechanosensitive ion channel n=1 Tax=Subsaximicrobium wynnwilliamsii TaxID=291179 RepID=A0A5C6ZK60_9FLAO|nr:mechanosensitive ion channel domain-containing protein [Subsaximicrobium wynnwilliamsii]TXD81580.1 mechanosensitive ion channel [Subsaximicrobium wynnwilliamsii]TXD89942.1 mechanosensitive ion channel [Subsaximicrobium wynnwilliamsii]TXE01041.1 mechanosensitive ion channel [Subsaximicrobium wynnwilliamsii]
MKSAQDWLNENPVIYSIIKYLLIVAAVLICIHFIRKVLKRNIPNTSVRYKSQKGIEILGYFIIIILSVSYFTGNIKDFTIAIGLFSAGVAFTLQELILSVAGSLYIFIVKVYAPGDRIELHGIKGDVIDVDSIYTTMMEIGQWVESDNYSGRIVKLSNSFVFKGPIYNYSKDFPFIWDQFSLPIRYGSDMELAKSIVINIASETLSEYTRASKVQWESIVAKYYIEAAEVEPTLAVTLTENWVQFNLRYIVDYKRRRSTKNMLNESILKAFEQTKGKVVLGSTTVELIKIPDLKVDVNKS